MAIVLTPSSFGGFMSCPYKRKNSVYDADPTNTAHGSLANAAAAAAVAGTPNKLGPWLRYYNNEINPLIAKKNDIEKLKTGMGKVYDYISQYNTADYQLRQEQKFEYRRPDEYDVWISGQPDVIIFYNHPNEKDGIVAEVIDLKCGSIDWYTNNAIWQENSQWFFYPRFVFQHFGLEIQDNTSNWATPPKIRFSFVVMDKKSGKLGVQSKELTENIADIQMKQHIKEFRDLQKQELDKKDYPARECRACNFCEFAVTCPLHNNKNLSETAHDDLF